MEGRGEVRRKGRERREGRGEEKREGGGVKGRERDSPWMVVRFDGQAWCRRTPD